MQMMKRTFLLSAALTAAVPCMAAETGADASAGQPFTVSGISSGAYMATQVHLAYSTRVDGAALLAAGPYGCAEGNIMNALGRCISGQNLSIEPLLERARSAAEAGRIDALEGLKDDRAWVFHGQSDAVVGHAVTAAARDFYAALLPTDGIAFVDAIPVAHGWPTLATGVACDTMGGDFINACRYDAAGALLAHLYGDLAGRGEAQAGQLREVPQTGVVPEGAGFAAAGYAYVPANCADTPGDCRLHVAFHGCRQGREFIEDRFARLSGLNEWAENNDIVVLYPQVESSVVNPQGCWDWWGYTGPDYDNHAGPQLLGILALVDAWSD